MSIVVYTVIIGATTYTTTSYNEVMDLKREYPSARVSLEYKKVGENYLENCSKKG